MAKDVKVRYSIVRVDIKCPIGIEEDISEIDRIKMFDCINKRQCGDCPYGDTKEQLVRKIAQVMLRRFKRMYKGKFITVEMAEKQYLETAKEIVEFLGVK